MIVIVVDNTLPEKSLLLLFILKKDENKRDSVCQNASKRKLEDFFCCN